MASRSIVYIDGFNLYYGSLKGTAYKWLDLQRLFERLRPDDEIQAIRYFTALVDGDAQGRQLIYLRALQTLPKVEVIRGRFKRKRFKCGVTACDFSGSRFYIGQEEKRTDVAIGIQLVDDAYRDLADRFILVSGDSDLVPAVRMVKLREPSGSIDAFQSRINSLTTAVGFAETNDRDA